jgi:hypothetical protein
MCDLYAVSIRFKSLHEQAENSRHFHLCISSIVYLHLALKQVTAYSPQITS